jgi:ATP-binding cassette, subfamily B, multidrug efflux pump
MRELFRILYPYCARHKLRYLWGALAVLVSNFLSVQATVWIGRTVELILTPGKDFLAVMPYVLSILAMTITGALGLYLTRIFLIGTSRTIEYDFRNDFFKHLTSLSPSFYDRIKSGDLISRATSDIEQVRMALGPRIMYPLRTVTLVPITLYAMLSSSWAITLACLSPILLMPLVVNLYSSLIYKRSLRIQENFSEFSGCIQESISGIRVVKSFVQKDFETGKLDILNLKNAQLNMSRARVQAVFFPVMITIFVFGVIIIVWSGGYFVTSDPVLLKTDAKMLSKGELLAFVLLYRFLFMPLLELGWVISVFQRAAASMHRILLIWNQKPEITDSHEKDPAPHDVRGEIEFQDLTFAYPQKGNPSLSNVSFHLPAGKALGVVGGVGSGKSTIAQLIGRLYDPPPGAVFIDGKDIRQYPLEVLRNAVRMVFQETYLFSDTITENISFGLASGADEAKAREAARLAAINDEVDAFPQKFQTMLGERGINLSGGQKQRVALARALICDPPILVLDDAFASVDTHTEEKILRGLREILRNRTTVLISHRISAVQMADFIIVLENGRVVEQGTHAELVAHGGIYADMYRRQLLEEEIAEGDLAK